MSDRAVSEDNFLMVYSPDKHKTQRMCDNDINDSLALLKFLPDRFLTIKMFKKLFTALYGDENILYLNKDSSNVVFTCNTMVILNIDVNNINLDNYYDEDLPDTITLIRLLAWHIKFEKRKGLKKQLIEDLMQIVQHPKR